MFSLAKLNSKAAYGACFFDRLCPGWHAKIDTEKLDINNTDDCIVGQLFGDYKTAVKQLSITESRSVRLGIYLLCHDTTKTEKQQWNNLTLAWKREIAQRLAKDARSVKNPAKDIIIPTRTARTSRQCIATRS